MQFYYPDENIKIMENTTSDIIYDNMIFVHWNVINITVCDIDNNV